MEGLEEAIQPGSVKHIYLQFAHAMMTLSSQYPAAG
jgi:hypothetical protein